MDLLEWLSLIKNGQHSFCQCHSASKKLTLRPEKHWMCVCLHWQSYITNIELFKIITMISEFCDRLNIVRLTSILEHWWKWDYLNAPVSGDAWIIIQPFFRRLEPQAAAMSRRKKGGGGGGRWWKWGEGEGARVKPWGEKRWKPIRESE